MQVVGIDDQSQLQILQLVAAILHIGNITFVEKDNYASVAGDDCTLRCRSSLELINFV